MADIKNLIRQHTEILELANKLYAYKNEQQVRNNAFEISLLLGQVSGKIKIHMTSEDRFLYPALSNHTDAKVRTISTKFADEMGDLAKAFETYKTKYLNSQEISSNPAVFLHETQAVLTALAKRIEKENRELYPLI